MTRLFDKIYQLSSYLAPINLGFHQYLIDGPKPLLVHTGPHGRAPSLLEELAEILGD